MPVAIVMVSVVGIVAGMVRVRGKAGWIPGVLLLGAASIWFVMEGVISAVGADHPAQFTRGEWTATWRTIQWLLWIGLVVASQIVLIRSAHRTK